MICAYDDMVRRVCEIGQNEEKIIRIVYRSEDRAILNIACEAKVILEKKHPFVRIELITPKDCSMLEMLEDDEADIALMYRPRNFDVERFRETLVLYDQLIVGMNAHHPIGCKSHYYLGDFAGSVFFYPISKTFADYYEYALGLFQDEGVSVNVRYVPAETSDQFYLYDDERRIWCFTKSTFLEGRSFLPSIAEKSSILCEIQDPHINANRYAIYRKDKYTKILADALDVLQRVGRVWGSEASSI